MLDPIYPLALVAGAVRPVHLAVAMALVIFERALVVVATCPLELASAVLLVFLEATLVNIGRWAIPATPLPITMALAVFKLTIVTGSILVVKSAFSVWLSIHKFAEVRLSVSKEI